MLISNKSITDLKVLSKTEAHTVFRNLKCATSRVRAEAQRGTPGTVQESEAKSSTEQKIRVFCGHPLLPSP